ncbi:CbiX/SirB N-terminal domain-containing protein [Poriferisphaera sp. WC338]|uniref:CbiX/SirB N-terminal domain-containing protein n=1 Tax=Poriferisphaera sp. WC338 TaxID=3425129 RepID=UPI003D81503C
MNHPIKAMLTLPLLATLVLSVVYAATAGANIERTIATSPSQTAIVLIGRGEPPHDFPKKELHQARHALNQMASHAHEIKNKNLALKLLNWPVTRENNPYYFGVKDFATELELETNCPVFFGFNEFCSPTTTHAIQSAIDAGLTNLVVISTMMTPPNDNHAEHNILSAMKHAQTSLPNVEMTYAWSSPARGGAILLRDQVKKALKK